MAKNFKDRVTENTSGLKSIEEMRAQRKEESKLAEGGNSVERKRPQTAVGAMGALAAAEHKLKELQSRADPKEIDVTHIRANPWQPRRVFDDESMEQLKNSIMEIGLIQPIVVRTHPDDKTQFELVVGERRLRAHEALGIKSISAWEVELTDEDMAVWALTENIAREDLSDYEISRSIDQLMLESPSRKQLAESLGISRAQLYRYISYSKLPELVLRTLEENPYVLGSNAAQALTKALDALGEEGLLALNLIWPDVVEGRLDQMKLANALAIQVSRNQKEDSEKPSFARKTTKLYQKGKVAGHIRRDANGLTIKIKTQGLSEQGEKTLREAVQLLYQTDEDSE